MLTTFQVQHGVVIHHDLNIALQLVTLEFWEDLYHRILATAGKHVRGLGLDASLTWLCRSYFILLRSYFWLVSLC